MPTHKKTEPLLCTVDLCARLGVRKDSLSKWRKLGLAPDERRPGKNNIPTDYWDIVRVRDWMEKNIRVRVVSEAIEQAGEDSKRVAYRAPAKGIAEGEGFDHLIQRVQHAERIHFARYAEAIKKDDALAIQARRESWLDLVEQLRKLEKDVADIRKARGELIERHAAEAENIRMCLTVKQQMMGLKGSLPVMLVGKDEAEMSILIERAVRDACLALVTGNSQVDAMIDRAAQEIAAGVA